MKKVAIVTPRMECYYDDDYHQVIDRVTEFTEVDEETYKLLVDGQYKYDYQVITFVENQKKFILDTVEKYKDFLQAEKNKREAEKRAAEEKKRERAFKKLAKTEAEERRLLQELLDKHGRTK